MVFPTPSDIIKVLEKIPEWTGLMRLPSRISALERKVAELERQLAERPARDACPSCGKPLTIGETRPHPTFGVMGMRVRGLRCAACGFTTEKEIKPGEV